MIKEEVSKARERIYNSMFKVATENEAIEFLKKELHRAETQQKQIVDLYKEGVLPKIQQKKRLLDETKQEN